MRTYRATRACAGLLAIAFAASAYAAESDGPTIIVTATHQTETAEADLRKTPGGTDFVPARDYADKSIVSLRDALAFSPGVYVQPRYGQEVRLSIRGSGISRGFHMRGITLLQDGVPINLADDNGDFQELDPAFFDHLAVYRGGNALRFGSGTLGGAINGVTPTGRTANGVFLRGDVGSFETVRGLVSAGFANGPGDGWVALQVDSSNGDRDHQKRKTIRVHGNIGLQISDNVETRLYASYNNIDQQIPGALDLNTALTNPKTGNVAGDQQRDIDSIRIQNRTRVTLGAASIAFGAFFNAKQLYHPIFQVVDQESSDTGLFATLNYERGPLSLTLGTTTRFGTVRSKRFINVNGTRGVLTFNADQRAQSTDIYGEVRFKPVERLTLVAGGIYADGFRQQDQIFPTAARGRADFDSFSPKIGLLYDPVDGVQVYANYNRSAEFPGFIELAQIASFTPLQEQSAWTAEVGTRGKSGLFSWDISLYRADVRGELLQFTVNANIPASTFNAGRTRHQGVEASFELKPAPWLQLRQLWQYSDFRFRGDAQFGNNRLPVIPEHLLRTELRIGTDALHIAPNLEWVPKGAWADYYNTLRVPGYTLLAISAGAQLRENLDLFLDVRNLADKKAVGDISAVISASPASVIFNPIERPAVYGGVRARF